MLNKRSSLPVLSGISVLILCGTLTLPGSAQDATQGQPAAQTPAAQTSAQPAADDSSTYATGKPLAGESKEGFWGHLNPFARKKWVNRQVDPLRDRENELDQLQSKNANEIRDVDARSQAGIHNAMDAANTADQHAADANNRADAANTLASNASDRTNALNTTVGNLDQYSAVTSTDVPFASGRTALGPQGKAALDDMAIKLAGEKGYVIEVEGFSKHGVQPSQAMADSVVRYLVEEHQVPIFRIYRTGMGKAVPANETAANDTSNSANGNSVAASDTEAPITNGVRITLLHNSLATMASNAPSSTQGMAQNTSAPAGSAQ
jgi:outer membrane protein OmpA-like peptidoglycan-associated protein